MFKEFTPVISVGSGEVQRKLSSMVTLELNLQRGAEVDGQPVEGRSMAHEGNSMNKDMAFSRTMEFVHLATVNTHME